MANIYDMTDTWNDGGTTFTAIKMDVTDTASAAASKLINLLVGSSSKFAIRKDGAIFLEGNSNGWLKYGGETGVAKVGSATSDNRGFFGLKTVVGSSGYYSFSDSNAITDVNDFDLALYRDAADTLAQRRSTNAQTFNIYNTFTNASNYERGGFKWNTNILEVFTGNAGTGSARDLFLNPAGSLRFGTHTAIGSETVTGYITIKDSGGTSRKLAVVS